MERFELTAYKEKLGYNLAQLELDYYQHFILEKLYAKFSSIYFKGGTCLQKCYGIKRFSEDLDFNYDGVDIKKVIFFIEGLFGTKIVDEHTTRFGISFSIKFEGMLYDGSERTKCKISFDFREKDIYNVPLKKIIRPPYADLGRYFILALDEEEITAEKIRAIITRFKARDVFDLNELLLNGIKIDWDLVNKKLLTYDKVFDKREFEERLEEKRAIYDEEMKRLTALYDDFDVCKKRIFQIIA